MKKLIRASLLALALSCTAYAGVMPFPAPDPQPAPASTQEPTTSNTQDGSATESILTEVVLPLAGYVLSLF
jgi:hypothetical protein